MVLFVNACTRRSSRTKRLAKHYLKQLEARCPEESGEHVTEIDLYKVDFPVTDENFLEVRDRLCAAGKFGDSMFAMARQFAEADRIVIAAPYWDLSFPSCLKQYLEQVSVLGITFTYSPEGIPQGLCRAKELVYVTTAGGDRLPWDFGYGYVKALAEIYYGIGNVRLIKADGLDLDGADPEQVLKEYMERLT